MKSIIFSSRIVTCALFVIYSFGFIAPNLAIAITPEDAHSIQNEVGFYDNCEAPSKDGSGDAAKGLESLFYPECATDDAKFAKVIDDYIAGYGSGNSPMKGLGKDFVTFGKKYDVNPGWAVAMAIHETSLGTAGVGQSCTNAFGIRTHDQYPNCSTGFSKYSSFKESTEDFFKLVSGPTYLKNPKNKTLLDIINIYAPASDGNDPDAYVKALLQPMEDILKEICGKGSSDNTTDSGDKSSKSEPLEGVATLKGHKIPASKGKYGYEQHLQILGPKGDGGNEQKHYEITNVPQGPLRNGMAGGAGALGTHDPIEEIYYIAMRWKYSGGGTGNEDSSWYTKTHPRVIVTYTDKKTKEKKQVIAAAVDWGPASSTGRVAGLSPEANKAIHPALQDDELEYAWAEDQTLEPGPVDGKTDAKPESKKPADTCGGKSSDGGDLGVSPDGFTFPLITTQKDVHFTQGDHLEPESQGGGYYATDIFEKEGTVWVAAVDGKIYSATEDQCNGAGDYEVPRLIIAGKDGKFYYYTHGKEGSLKVKDGQTVKAGDELGEIGPTQCAMMTATHLHFQANKKADIGPCSRDGGCNKSLTIDPYPWLKEAYKYLPKK